jgi:hypothetical protein
MISDGHSKSFAEITPIGYFYLFIFWFLNYFFEFLKETNSGDLIHQ